jgi:DsbC/DsbD-like thiol-disulfide interchange protein
MPGDQTMRTKLLTRRLPAVLLLFASAWAPADSGPVQRDHIEVELIAATTSVRPGQSLRVGLRMLPDAGWHTYWRNPGDSGLPTRIRWHLPAGAQASDIDWPFPEALPFAHLINYGYEGEHLLPVTIGVPADLGPGSEFLIRADAEWLLCEEICIPGNASLKLSLPVADQSPASDLTTTELFAWADQRLPTKVNWPARFSIDAGRLIVHIEPEGMSVDRQWAFFSALENLVDHAEPAEVQAAKGRIAISQKLSPFLAAEPETVPVVVVDTIAGKAWEMEAVAGEP